MRPSIKAALLFVLFQIAVSYTYAQSSIVFLEQTVETLNKQSAALPLEKAYLQTDKPIYAAGDTIWFKGYVTIGVLHRLSTKSGLLNVQLVNARNNNVVQYIKLELNNGTCDGLIALSDSLEAGTYRLRAYTNWMHNFGDDYFFQQNITIGNAIVNNVFSKATYTYNHNSQGQQLNAGISYTDVSGSPYTNKEVRYSIVKAGETIYNNKGATDDNGNLKISYQSADTSFFDQGTIRTSIQLDKTNVARDISIKTGRKPVSVQFFPEGGYMVNGLQNTVAFKSIGNDGLGKDITGTITDNDNNEITQISSTHLGMGKFTFIPQSGKTYQVKVDESIINLPIARNNGYNLSVNNTDTAKIIITITGTDTTGNLNFVARSGGLACYAAGVKMAGGFGMIRIPKSKLPSGVVQFTLFSNTGEPLNERLAFINHHEELLNLILNADKNSYQPRERVNINLSAQDYNNKPVCGSFSAAVINETGIESSEKEESSILSALLLTSGIKGNIEQPGYYFNEPTNKTEADLDLLMLTQGYRGFEWKEIAGGNIKEAAYIPEKSLVIAGTLKTPQGKTVTKGKIRLFTTTGPLMMVDTLTDGQGRFKFEGMTFKDSTKFVLQANNDKGKSNVIIEIDNKDGLAFNSNGYSIEAEKDSVPLAYLQNSKKQYLDDIKYGTNRHSTLLKDVVIKEKAPEVRSSNLSGPGHNSQIIMAKELETCGQLKVCLIGKLHGVVIDVGGIPHSPRNRSNLASDDVMTVILDGVQIILPRGGSPFDVVNPMDVASIELLMDPADLAIYGLKGNHGIIIINTKKGDEEPEHFFKAMNVLDFMPKGYYVARKFYTPNYDVAAINKKPDLRSTIYWKPDLLTDENGNVAFSYFNGDTKGSYRVLVEGIDNNGNIGRGVYRYEVK
jgi:hypothetical protein